MFVKDQTTFTFTFEEPDCDLRQASVYALGLMVEQLKTDKLSNYLERILKQCFNLWEDNSLEESRHYDNVLDNGASTIGKTLAYHENVTNE